jgi:hypothetical protein
MKFSHLFPISKRRYSQYDMFSMEWLIYDGGIAIRDLKNLGRMLNIIDNQSNCDDDLYGRFASVTPKTTAKPPRNHRVWPHYLGAWCVSKLVCDLPTRILGAFTAALPIPVPIFTPRGHAHTSCSHNELIIHLIDQVDHKAVDFIV